jgi:hypothetical protein
MATDDEQRRPVEHQEQAEIEQRKRESAREVTKGAMSAGRCLRRITRTRR